MSFHRNPYLILGVPFGTDRDDARRAFALSAKRLRVNPDGPYSVEDLTWALHEIESLEADPDQLVDLFRVPADPNVFQTGGHGVFRPAPVPMDRRTEPRDPAARAEVRERAALELLQVLIRTYSGGVDFDAAYEG